MLEKVKQHALEMYNGDEGLANSFVDGFVKQAAQTIQTRYDGSGQLDSRTITNAPDIVQKGIGDLFQEGISQAVGKGIGGLAVGLGIHGLNAAFSSATHGSLKTAFLTALAKAISMNTVLREADRSRVEQYADTIFRFAPHVAGDANLLSSILANAIQGHEGAGIDPMTIKTLGDLESRYVENRTAGGFSPKTYV